MKKRALTKQKRSQRSPALIIKLRKVAAQSRSPSNRADRISSLVLEAFAKSRAPKRRKPARERSHRNRSPKGKAPPHSGKTRRFIDDEVLKLVSDSEPGSDKVVISFASAAAQNEVFSDVKPKEIRLDPFTRLQKKRLLQLRDAMIDSMAGVAQDTLRAHAEDSEASAFGTHQADAGSDAYDRDFALSLLSREQEALYEIDEALKRIELGTYGKCEISRKPIMRARLEAIPFARFTAECQSQIEREGKTSRIRQSVTSLFGLTDEEAREGKEEQAEELEDSNENLLSDLTRKCINSAEWIAEKFNDEPNFEWSCAILPLCKGLENELHERMLLPLRENSRADDLLADCNDADLAKVARYCAGKASKPPEIGVFAWFLSTAIHSKARSQTSALLRSFVGLVAMMANKQWILAKDGLLASLNRATTKYRNPAAHLESMSRHDYLECREFLIGLGGVLWILLNATRLSYTAHHPRHNE